MSIRFACRGCRQPLTVRRRQAGSPVVCPRCRRETLAPSSSGGVAPPKPAPVAAPFVPPPAAPVQSPPTRAADPARRLHRRVVMAAAALAVLVIAVSAAVAVCWPGPDPTAAAPANEVADSTPADPDDEGTEPELAERRDAPVAASRAGAEEEERSSRSADPSPAEELPAPAELPAAPAPAVVARREPPAPLDRLTEDALRGRLVTAPEVGLRPAELPRIVKSWRTEFTLDFQARGDVSFGPAALLHVRPDLATLPIRYGRANQISGAAAVELQRLARHLHGLLDVIDPTDLDGKRGDPAQLRQILRGERLGRKPLWLRAEAIPTLLQILTPEAQPLREVLVELLAAIDGRQASVALAKRAVFDLSPTVRRQALAALRTRPREDARLVFLDALRYPWAPPAQHAAEALVALDDRDSVPSLVTLLKEPTPLVPFRVNKDHWAMHEVVGLRHVNNCLACHPPALGKGEPVPGTIPNVTVTGSGQGGASGGGGGRWGGGGSPIGGPGQSGSPIVVRADIAYLRQDFSVQQDVPLPGGARRVPVRFDYLVRTRLLTAREAGELRKQTTDLDTYPQREAVLYALRELTGRDAGSATAAWEALYPGSEVDARAGRLTLELLAATGERREALLVRCRDGKGGAYTDALSAAIPRLPAEVQKRARALLAERLTRMSAKTLRDKLADDDTEVRRAAVVACVRLSEADHVPDLIALLDDSEPVIARLAQDGLKKLTGQGLESADAWKEWWQSRAGE